MLSKAEQILSMEYWAILAGAGLLAGSMNAVAGGGSFVTIPALLATGMPSVLANTSSTVALFPGSVASAWAYRDDFKPFEGVSIRLILLVSLLGSIVGALLLLWTPTTTFDTLIPWLLLVATVAFAFGRQVGEALRKRIRIHKLVILAGQAILGIYGGYFGGAVGIMMMAAWSLLGVTDLKAMNAAKTLLVGATNAVAVFLFVLAGSVQWSQTIIVLAAAVVGGYVGAQTARHLDPKAVRIGITVMNVVMTGLFFYRTYGR